ncbi:mutS domain II family protein, partial [Vibrio parahaemolyticus 10296]
NS